MPFLKGFKFFLSQLEVFNWHTTLPDGERKNIIRADLSKIGLAPVKIIYVFSIEVHSRILIHQVHNVCFSFPFVITKTIGSISMQDHFLAEIAVGTKIKPEPESLHCIAGDPVLPWANQEFSNAHIACSNEIDPAG